jgi:citrate lyase subunit beta / citryl-CoA lyase
MGVADDGSRVRRRSWIIMPADKDRYTTKAGSLVVDVVILDLEDGVIEANKDAARAAASRVAQDWDPNGPALFLRVNAPGSVHFAADVEVLHSTAFQGVLLPKAAADGSIRELVTRMREVGVIGGARTPDIVLCLESPQSVLHADVLASQPEVAGVIVGIEDLSRELGVSPEGRTYLQASEFVRAAIAFGAISMGKYAIDCHYPLLDDDAGLLADARKARNLGFEGKGVFHPSQIDIVNAAFAPTSKELEDAITIVRSYEEALASGAGTSYAAGQLVDLPVVDRARRVLALANQQGFAAQDTTSVHRSGGKN